MKKKTIFIHHAVADDTVTALEIRLPAEALLKRLDIETYDCFAIDKRYQVALLTDTRTSPPAAIRVGATHFFVQVDFRLDTDGAVEHISHKQFDLWELKMSDCITPDDSLFVVVWHNAGAARDFGFRVRYLI
jgi:hypothetical protein